MAQHTCEPELDNGNVLSGPVCGFRGLCAQNLAPAYLAEGGDRSDPDKSASVKHLASSVLIQNSFEFRIAQSNLRKRRGNRACSVRLRCGVLFRRRSTA